MFTARPLTADQAEAFVALRREMLLDSPWAFGASPGHDRGSDAAQVRSSLSRPPTDPEYALLGVWSEEQSRFLACAGVARAEPPKRRHLATIWGVYVTPGARGRGLGREVVGAAIRTARGWPGITALQLTVSENAPTAQALYRSLGFRQWGHEPDALHVDGCSYAEVHMHLPL